MPTPITAFADAAAKYGDIDPNDIEPPPLNEAAHTPGAAAEVENPAQLREPAQESFELGDIGLRRDGLGLVGRPIVAAVANHPSTIPELIRGPRESILAQAPQRS